MSWTPVILAHTVAAVVALVLGGFNALRRTRGDALHRAVGRIWAVLMLTAAVPSFWIGGYVDTVDLILHGLAVLTIVSVSLGWWAARTGRTARHARAMVGAYLGLLGALVGVLVVPERRVPTAFRDEPVMAGTVTAVLVAVAVALIVWARRSSGTGSGAASAEPGGS